jgi:hypothetical protein
VLLLGDKKPVYTILYLASPERMWTIEYVPLSGS